MYKIIFKDRWKKGQRQDKLPEKNHINSAFSFFIFKVKNYLLLIWLIGLGNPSSTNNGKVLDWKGETGIKRYFFLHKNVVFSGQAETVADSKNIFSQTAHPPLFLNYNWNRKNLSHPFCGFFFFFRCML